MPKLQNAIVATPFHSKTDLGDWQTKPLGEICSLISRGISPKYLNDGGIRVLNQRCIRDHGIDWSASRRHDDNEKRVASDRFLQFGDGLINSTGTGTLGRVAQVLHPLIEPTTVDSHVTIVRPKTGIFHPEFFGYMLIDIEDQLKDSGEGCGGQTELARSDIAEKFVLRFPSCIHEQKRIVSILDQAYESLKEAEASVNQALSRSTELYESYLERSVERGGEGWTKASFKDVCTIENGSQPPKSTFQKTATEDNVRLIQIRDYKSDKHLAFISKRHARSTCSFDDVMIGRYGPPVFQILRGLEGAYNVALMKAVPDERKVSKDFLFYFLKGR